MCVSLSHFRRERQRQEIGSCSQAICHVISRSSPFSGTDSLQETRQDIDQSPGARRDTKVVVVHSPNSGNGLFTDLKQYDVQESLAFERTIRKLCDARRAEANAYSRS